MSRVKSVSPSAFFHAALFIGMAALVPAATQALEALPDAELSAATGREGIGLQIELRVNADSLGQPLTSSTLAANSADFANCNNLTNFSSTACRLALKFANRNDGGGEWLVAKNFYGRINMPLIYLDSAYTPATASPYADLDRFKDKSGAPLLASPNKIPMIKVAFPKDIEMWNVTIGGLGIEHGATGYLTNGHSTVGGIKISNSVPGMPAKINFQGAIGVYGF